MKPSITHTPANQMMPVNSSGDAGSPSARQGDQAWRREIERAQACAWLRLPPIGFATGCMSAGSPQLNANSQPTLTSQGATAVACRSHQPLDPAEGATEEPQGDDSRRVRPASIAEVAPATGTPQGTQQPPSGSAAGQLSQPAGSAARGSVKASILSAAPAPGISPPRLPVAGSAMPAPTPQPQDERVPVDRSERRFLEPSALLAGDRNPVRLSLALQGNAASLWLGIDEHVRPLVSLIVSATIKDLKANGLSMSRVVCNGEEVAATAAASHPHRGTRFSIAARQPPPAEQPHPTHPDRGERQ